MAQGKAFTEEQRASIIESLRTYLELGFSRNKACKMVGLDPTTLSKWVQADEALSIKLQGWENAINAQVMANLADAIRKEGETEDVRKETSKWWAERRMKEDFSTRQENTGADGKDLPQPIISLDALRGNNGATQNSEPTEED